MNKLIQFHKFLTRPYGDDLILLNSENGEMYKLNESAQCIWNSIHAHQNEDAAAKKLADTYALTIEEAKESVKEFIEELAEIQ